MMKIHSWFAMNVVLMVSLTGCTVWSVHPALPDNGHAPDVSALLGDWQVVEVATQGVPASVVFRVVQGIEGEVSFTMPSNADVEPRRGVVTEIGGELVVSIERETGIWDLFRPMFQDDGTVDVFTWDLEALRLAVAEGVINGSGLEFSFDGEEIEVREPPASLAQKLREHPELFDFRIAVLRRAP